MKSIDPDAKGALIVFAIALTAGAYIVTSQSVKASYAQVSDRTSQVEQLAKEVEKAGLWKLAAVDKGLGEQSLVYWFERTEDDLKKRIVLEVYPHDSGKKYDQYINFLPGDMVTFKKTEPAALPPNASEQAIIASLLKPSPA